MREGRKIRAFTLSGSTQKVNVGPLPLTNPTVIVYLGGFVEAASGSIIVTDNGGNPIDQIWATASSPGRSWLGPEGLTVNGPLTVTVTGTVAGAVYIG